MINFQLDEEQSMLTTAIRRFAQERVRKVFRDADEDGEMPADVIAAGWELGVLPTSIPEASGGFGDHSMVTSVLATEAFAWGDLAAALAIMTPGLVAVPVMLEGSEAQKEAYLPQFCEEIMPPMTAALTEPRMQYDPRHLETTATREGDEYVLNGVKCMVPRATAASLILVYAREGEGNQAFLVPADAPGLVIGEREKLMGVKALPTYGVTLTDVRVPASSRLGEARGINFDRILNYSRVTLGAAAVGLARAAYEYAVEYAKTRQQFGEPIAHRQSIAFMLAEMAIDIDAARLMVWETAWKMDKGEDVTRDVSVMKYYTDNMVLRVADQALQTLGGYGYIREYPVELWLRNARGFATFDGMAIA